ncbi:MULTISPECIES: branched-chain amino acid aminotransferase [unclassified Lactococcus]|uniref:branched-chain amino acid aminotransferase n=1 Tax=unclassified Lactococcus TaxID=2643510 RepID=UPI0011CBACB6|nr:MULTISPECIES: branched-chain amino acid aminotransferase [unclassified Lactococcus]MQW23323.1 branched-chain amino acid aminotransferase [Lactococcus sp. dk101]TXK37975.1 branched-chain amino acid aminotransferase [Lactococcus sp. dk310]TXK49629.1 branched-chain amino acid aminotransferase [Lactococcus sp. dk322]
MTVELDWENLGFEYRNLPFRYISYYKDGKWDEGSLTGDAQLHLSESSPALHYGQQGFEGLKAYRTKNGDIQLFRPDRNAARLQATAKRLRMAEVPTEKFIDAVMQVVKANEEFVPPYGTGATLYIRPLLIGVGDVIGVKPATEYIFTVFAMPVGSYFKGGLAPSSFVISREYDRAAPLGTGGSKVGGNYAASLQAEVEAKEGGYADAIYLDPATHTKIEEVGAANFFGITANNEFITPLSPSILPSITKYSLLYLAEHHLGMKAIEGDVYVTDLDQFVEVGACGTAAVITPVGSIDDGEIHHVFHSETEVGPTIRRLFDELVGIQFGDVEAPEGWIYKVK